ncbi:hypothetical protein ES707_16099 [subsurface metagenome]
MNTLRKIFTFKFDFNKDTIFALILGFSVVGLSFLMKLFHEDTSLNNIICFIILDIIIKVVLGFYLPIRYLLVKRKKSLEIFGITKKRWKTSLILGLIFMGLLFFQFISESGQQGQEILLRSGVYIPIFYIFVAGIFEMTFIYGFLRRIFDESFGIIPGIVLTSLFYSFHHAGFQPEFAKLIFVGIMYASIYRITNNILIIFPFFWGIGAIWDVLVNFGTNELQGTGILLIALCTLILMTFAIFLLKKENEQRHNSNDV